MLYIFHVQKHKLNPRLETQTRQIFVVSGSLMLARIKAPRELNFNLFPRHIIKKKIMYFFLLFLYFGVPWTSVQGCRLQHLRATSHKDGPSCLFCRLTLYRKATNHFASRRESCLTKRGQERWVFFPLRCVRHS